MDAAFTSIEAQKSKGSLHAHSQLFVQCMHQHTPLVEVLRALRAKGGNLVQKYLVYKAHVCREADADPLGALARRTQYEGEWPEYKQHEDLHSDMRWRNPSIWTHQCELEIEMPYLHRLQSLYSV